MYISDHPLARCPLTLAHETRQSYVRMLEVWMGMRCDRMGWDRTGQDGNVAIIERQSGLTGQNRNTIFWGGGLLYVL